MKKFLKDISFTKNEIRVIVFIISVVTSGLVIKYYKQVLAGNSGKQYDYSASDNKFRALSDKINRKDISETDSIESDETESLKKLMLSEDSLKKVKVNEKEISTDLDIEIININTATAEELTELPGVGESTAEKIILYRNEVKGFKKKEDIMNVKGIGKKKFENIKNYIKTE